MLNSIVLGDCLEVMEDIPDGSVDMILCDLPYGTTACKWDTVIPFEPLWEQYKRVIKVNGAIVLTASQPFTSLLITSAIDLFKYSWVWEKENGTNFFNAKHQPMKVHEDVCVFSLSGASYTPRGSMAYFPQMVEGIPYTARNNQDTGLMQFHAQPKGKKANNEGVRYPRSVQRFNSDRGLHPTQKPVALFEYLIKTYTKEGEVVLDNCIGSGTTAIAAINTNRQYIGIEKDSHYWEVASDRVAKHLEQLSAA